MTSGGDIFGGTQVTFSDVLGGKQVNFFAASVSQYPDVGAVLHQHREPAAVCAARVLAGHVLLRASWPAILYDPGLVPSSIATRRRPFAPSAA